MIKQSNIREIFFMTKEGGLLLLHVPYVKVYPEPVLTAAFISAIGTFAQMGVGKIEVVGRERTDLLLIEGNDVVLSVILDKDSDLEEIELKLIEVLEEFEENYKWQILKADGALNGYYKFTFDCYLKIPIYDISANVIFERTGIPTTKDKLKGMAYERMNVLLEAVNGIRTVEDIIGTTWHIMDGWSITTLLGYGYHVGILKEKMVTVDDFVLKFVDCDMFGNPYPDYVLNKLVETMYNAFGDEQMNTLLPLCDGTKTIVEISEELHVEKEILVLVVNELVKLGGIVLIESELEWAL